MLHLTNHSEASIQSRDRSRKHSPTSMANHMYASRTYFFLAYLLTCYYSNNTKLKVSEINLLSNTLIRAEHRSFFCTLPAPNANANTLQICYISCWCWGCTNLMVENHPCQVKLRTYLGTNGAENRFNFSLTNTQLIVVLKGDLLWH